MKTYFKTKLEGYTPKQIRDNGCSAKRELAQDGRAGQRLCMGFVFKDLKHHGKILIVVSSELLSPPVYILCPFKRTEFLENKRMSRGDPFSGTMAYFCWPQELWVFFFFGTWIWKNISHFQVCLHWFIFTAWCVFFSNLFWMLSGTYDIITSSVLIWFHIVSTWKSFNRGRV